MPVGVSLGGQQTARTPWGDPDLQGVFTTDDELGVPFERPPQFGSRAVVTEEEFNSAVDAGPAAGAQDAEEFVAERPAGRGGGDGTGPPATGWSAASRPGARRW